MFRVGLKHIATVAAPATTVTATDSGVTPKTLNVTGPVTFGKLSLHSIFTQCEGRQQTHHLSLDGYRVQTLLALVRTGKHDPSTNIGLIIETATRALPCAALEKLIQQGDIKPPPRKRRYR